LKTTAELTVKLFADGADLQAIAELAADPNIKGFTTNPTLMRQAGVEDYTTFAHEMLDIVPDRPVSFEVFSDEFDEMERQAREIASWGRNVFVKIPVTNSRGESSAPLIQRLSRSCVQLNVTAILAPSQIPEVISSLTPGVPSFVSVFAGRIADTGRDPLPLMRDTVSRLEDLRGSELIWASPRELLNVFQADDIGCHVITATPGILKKLSLVGKDLSGYSLETVQMFYRDASQAGYDIATAVPALPAAA